jgi:hypothetical protein
MGVTYNNRIVTDGLVLCLDAASKRSYPGTGATWTDLKGVNNGTMNNMGASNFSSENSGSLSFDRSNESVNLNTSPQDLVGQGSATTISSWFNINNTNQCMMIGNGTTDRYYIEIYNRGGSLVAHWGFGNSQNSSTSQAFVSTDTWYHYTATYDQSVAKAYLNGVNTDSDTIGSKTYGGALYVGSWGTNGFLWGGKIAMVSIYNRALNADEILQNYLSTKERYA